MPIERRRFLTGTTALASLSLLPRAAFASMALSAEAMVDHSGLPMPAPGNALVPRAAVADPNRLLLDSGWLFYEGDIETPPPVGHSATYGAAKAGAARGPAGFQYDDSDWPAVRLPHDWASFQPYEEAFGPSQGYRRRGTGWYRRAFPLDPADRGKYLELQFGGISNTATIWVNGIELIVNRSGYNSVYIDISDIARFGDDANQIAIRVGTTAIEGWWYEGAGLYRHAWLVKRDAVSIVTDGIRAMPVHGEGGRWSVPVTATLRSIAAAPADVEVEATLIDPSGRTVATGRATARVEPLAGAEATLTLDAGAPALWSPETPALYTLHTRLLRDGAAIDERTTRIGFRTARFDAARGFVLNDRPVKLKGACIHQDHAGVGVAMPDTLWEWKVRRLRQMGCNAIRAAVYPRDEAFLDVCDRLGMLVMADSRNLNTAPDFLEMLEWQVRRDRNRPSIVLMGLYNEEPWQSTEQGVAMTRRMGAIVHRMAPGLATTAAMNGGFFDPINVTTVTDVAGFNYSINDYDRFHALNPTKPLTSTEDTSAFMTRGAFATDMAAHVMSSYDTEKADWGETFRRTWQVIEARPFVAASFIWTGFDYHGEPSPFEWPSVSSFFGAMDMCGFPKTAFDIKRAHWIDDALVVALAPHWTWPGLEGQPIKVLVTCNAERVALLLNGRPLGEAKVDRIMGNEWQVPYAPGRLEAVAYRAGRIVARAAVETAGPAVALRLTPDRTVMAGDGEDAQPVTIDAVDARGRHVPIVNAVATFAATGASIIGLGNGDPNSHEPEKGDRRSLFNGLAQVIVQADEGGGATTLRATAPGLRPATLRIVRRAVASRAAVATIVPVQLLGSWRRSPPFVARPDPSVAPADSDMNSWEYVRPGTAVAAAQPPAWRVYRTRFEPRRRAQVDGAVLTLEDVVGTAELWIDGTLAARKDGAAAATMRAPVAPGPGARTVVLLVRDTDTAGGTIGRRALVTRRGEDR